MGCRKHGKFYEIESKETMEESRELGIVFVVFVV